MPKLLKASSSFAALALSSAFVFAVELVFSSLDKSFVGAGLYTPIFFAGALPEGGPSTGVSVLAVLKEQREQANMSAA